MTVPVVVVLLLVLDDDPGFEDGVEFVHVQAFVADSIVERFDVPVLPRLTRGNISDSQSVLAERPQRLFR